jgi:hypothetical protein
VKGGDVGNCLVFYDALNNRRVLEMKLFVEGGAHPLGTLSTSKV